MAASRIEEFLLIGLNISITLAVGLYLRLYEHFDNLVVIVSFFYATIIMISAVFIGFIGINFKKTSKFISSAFFFLAFSGCLIQFKLNSNTLNVLGESTKDLRVSKGVGLVILRFCNTLNALRFQSYLIFVFFVFTLTILFGLGLAYYERFFSFLFPFVYSFHILSLFLPGSTGNTNINPWGYLVAWGVVFAALWAFANRYEDYAMSFFFAHMAVVLWSEQFLRFACPRLADLKKYNNKPWEFPVYYGWLVICISSQFYIRRNVNWNIFKESENKLADGKNATV